jgi:two-component system, NarL family, sensor histidine kinase EvgS
MIHLLITFIFSSFVFAGVHFTQDEKEFIKNTSPIMIGSINSYTPFSFLQADQKVGFTQDLIDIIAQKSGLKFNKVNGTWPEIYSQFKKGKIEVISELSYKKERLPFTFYTKPYYEIPIGIFTRKEFGEYRGITSLYGKKVGVVKNSYLLSILKTIPEIETLEIDSSDERFFALRDKKVDAVLSNSMSQYRVEKLMIQDIKLTSLFTHPDVKSEDLRFGITKTKPLLASIINKTLDSIPFSEISKLKEKWILNSNSLGTTIELTEEEKLYLQKKHVITMCIDPNWMPFESFDNKGNYIGMSADYYAIFEKILPIKFQVQQVKNWSESINLAKQRKCDILSLAMETPQRKHYLNFTTPYLTVPLVITTNLEVPFINEIQDIKGKKVAITKGYAFAELLRLKYPELTIVDVENIDEGLKQVAQGKLFGFIGTLATVAYKLQENFAAELKIAGKLSDNWELGIGVRNDDIILLNILQKAINHITYGQRREILNKWISIKYEQKADYKLIWQTSLLFLFILLIISYFLYKQKVLNKQLKLQKNEFETIFRNSKDGIAILDLESNFLTFNDEYLKMTGYKRSELIHKSCIGLTAPEDIDKSKVIIKQVIEKGYVQNFEKTCVVKNNKRVSVNMSLSLMPDKQRILISTKDITQLKQLESQAKLASMGEMIANIAHQWRQPLSVISTAATGMKMQKHMGVLEDTQMDNFCDAINENSQYLSQTIDDFRNFLKGDSKPINFNLKNDTDSFLKIVDSTIKNYSIQLILDLDKNIYLKGYPNELIQCFINIFNNSKDAFLENNIDKKERYVFITQQIKMNKLFITFKDNAGGIPDDILPKVFEPYFTTKHQSQGTGLGLHMSYNIIVNRMGGTIEAANRVYAFQGKHYKGAKFTIILPL